jgi:hypothetical protein
MVLSDIRLGRLEPIGGEVEGKRVLLAQSRNGHMPPIQKSLGSFPATRGIPWHTYMYCGIMVSFPVARGVLEKHSRETPIKKILEKCVILLLLSKTRAQHAPQRSQLCYTQPKVPIILCDMMLLVSSYGHRQERPHSYIVEMLVNIFICVDRPRISR